MDIARAKALTVLGESRRAVSYWDTSNPRRRTVGVGFNMDAAGACDVFARCCPGANFGSVYDGAESLSEAHIDALFAYTFERACWHARGLISGFDTLPDDAQAVVVDMIFNMGPGKFGTFNKLRLALGESRRDYYAAAEEMVRSKWYGQVKSRAVRLVGIMRAVAKAELAQKASVKA